MKTIEHFLLLPNFERAWDGDPDSIRALVNSVTAGSDQSAICCLQQRLHSKKRRMGKCHSAKALKIPITPQEIDFFIYALNLAKSPINYEVDFPQDGVVVELEESLKARIAQLKASDFLGAVNFLSQCEPWRRNLLRFFGSGTTRQTFLEWHQRVSRASSILVSFDEENNVTGLITFFQDDAHRATLAVCLDSVLESYGLLERMIKAIIPFATENYRTVEIRIPSSWQTAITVFQDLEFEGKQVAYVPRNDRAGEDEPEFLFQTNPRKFASKYYKENQDGTWNTHDSYRARSISEDTGVE